MPCMIGLYVKKARAALPSQHVVRGTARLLHPPALCKRRLLPAGGLRGDSGYGAGGLRPVWEVCEGGELILNQLGVFLRICPIGNIDFRFVFWSNVPKENKRWKLLLIQKGKLSFLPRFAGNLVSRMERIFKLM